MNQKQLNQLQSQMLPARLQDNRWISCFGYNSDQALQAQRPTRQALLAKLMILYALGGILSLSVVFLPQLQGFALTLLTAVPGMAWLFGQAVQRAPKHTDTLQEFGIVTEADQQLVHALWVKIVETTRVDHANALLRLRELEAKQNEMVTLQRLRDVLTAQLSRCSPTNDLMYWKHPITDEELKEPLPASQWLRHTEYELVQLRRNTTSNKEQYVQELAQVEHELLHWLSVEPKFSKGFGPAKASQQRSSELDRALAEYEASRVGYG